MSFSISLPPFLTTMEQSAVRSIQKKPLFVSERSVTELVIVMFSPMELPDHPVTQMVASAETA